MEYVKGVPITDYCDTARLSITDRLKLLVPVCEAVQHAHHKGIVHRDLKPSNVLVCLYDGKPVPKVIDFGLAKALHQPLTDQTMFTAHGVVLGTPLYMSPEQAELNNLDVDTRSDVYSLGVILYELMTGTTPLEKQRFQQAAWHEVVRLIQHEEPPRPSLRLSSAATLPSLAAQRGIEPLKLSRMLQGELDWIVLKALEKDRTRRYGTPAELAGDMERYLKGDIVQARPPSAGYRLRKFYCKHRAAVITAAGFLGFLLGAMTVTALLAIRATEAEKQAQRARVQAEAAARAESTARARAEDQAFALKFLDRRRVLELNHSADPHNPTAFLNLADLMRESVAASPAWREHATLFTLLAGSRLAGFQPLPDTPGEFAIVARLSPDRRRVLIEAENRTLSIRDFPALTRPARIEGKLSHDSSNHGAFLDGGRLVTTCSDDGRDIRLWDTATGQPVGPPLHHESPAPTCIVARRGRRLVSYVDQNVVEDADGSTVKIGNRRLFLWHAGQAQPVATIDTGPVDPTTWWPSWHCLIAPDGSWFAVTNNAMRTFEIRSGTDGSVLHRLGNVTGKLNDLAVDDTGRYLALALEREVRIYDTTAWDRPAEVVPDFSIGNIRWVSGSDRVIGGNLADGISHGLVRGTSRRLAFEPVAVREGLILADDGQVYRLESGQRVDPGGPGGYPLEARAFARDGRWLLLPDRLVDLALGQAIPGFDGTDSYPARVLVRLDRDGIGWCLIDEESSDVEWSRLGVRVWALPADLARIDADMLRLWAEVVCGARLDGDQGSRRLSESEWDARRADLASRLAAAGGLRLPGFDPDDRHDWLRQELARLEAIGEALSEDAWKRIHEQRLALVNRLVAEVPSGHNLVWRSNLLSNQDDDRGAFRDLLAAVETPVGGGWALAHRSVGESLLLIDLLRQGEKGDLHALVDRYVTGREKALGPFQNYERPLLIGLTDYRQGRMDQAVAVLESTKVGKRMNSEGFVKVLVRAMARKRLGQDAAAQADYEASRPALGDEVRWRALATEADALFEKPQE
jgi:hypothetical protein